MLDTRVEIFLLGYPRIVINGQEITIKRHSSIALAAYLAVNQQPHSRSTIAAFFHPADHPSKELENFRKTTLYELRDKLPKDILMATSAKVKIDFDRVWVDANVFTEKIHALINSDMEIEAFIENVLQLYTDDFLAGFDSYISDEFDRWRLHKQHELRSLLSQAYSKLIQHFCKMVDVDRAIQVGQDWVRHDVENEEAHAYLIHLYALSGNRAMALQQYQHYVDVVHNQMNLPLSEKIQNLYRTISNGLTVPPLSSLITTKKVIGSNIKNPYKGLEAFKVDDSQVFFGRKKLVDEMLNLLAQDNLNGKFLAIVGPSGSGKSSVARAGLLAAIREGALLYSKSWTIVEVRPGHDPFEQMAHAFRKKIGGSFHTYEKKLKDTETGLANIAKEILVNDEAELVIFIDQFEEVFTQVTDHDKIVNYLDLLYFAISRPASRVRIIIILRADYYDRPLYYSVFGNLVGKHTVIVEPLTPEELEEAIIKPALQTDVRIMPSVVGKIISEMDNERGLLPMLQYTLSLMFDRRTQGNITFETYQNVGGVLGAMEQRLQALYSKLSPDQQDVLRRIFLRLVTISDDKRVRQVALLSDLCEKDATMTMSLINQFASERFIVLDYNYSSGQTIVELAHEALITWSQYKIWLDEASQDLNQYESLKGVVNNWLSNGRNKNFLITGAQLQEFSKLETSSAVTPNKLAQEFLRLSQEKHKENEALEQARIKQTAYQNRIIKTVLGVLATVLMVGTVILLSIYADNNSQLETEATTLQAIIITSEFQSEYTQAQVQWLSNHQFPISPSELTQTPPPVFFPTATAQASLAHTWQPVKEIINGVEMVKVPEGCFWMGSNRGNADEIPVHEICFDTPFWIDQYEVTNQQFEQLGGESAYTPDWEDVLQPRTSITWTEARQFCARRGAKLPTEAQWEYAARGIYRRIYPWGNEWNPDLSVHNGNSNRPEPVGNRVGGVSWVGAYDMSGNVWEWTSSIYQPYPYRRNDGREDPTILDKGRVVRGGSFYIPGADIYSATRRWFSPMSQYHYVGFRCVVDALDE